MICLGNICRSPLAEGILKYRIGQLDLNWTVESAGTGGWHVGNPPDIRAIQVALKYGIDIQNKRGRLLSTSDFNDFDLLLVMDESNLQTVRHLNPHSKKIHFLTAFSPHLKNKPVPDPYYEDSEAFEKVFDMVDTACADLIRHFTEHNP